MSFRGRGGNRGSGFNRGGGGGRGGGNRGGANRGGGGNFRKFETGPPEKVIPLGYFDYVCQEDLVCKVTIQDVPFFNAPIFLENKEQIGKIDEIFGNLRDYFVTVKLSDNMKASSFKQQQKVCDFYFDYFTKKFQTTKLILSLNYHSCSLILPNCCHCIDFCPSHHNLRVLRKKEQRVLLVVLELQDQVSAKEAVLVEEVNKIVF